MQLFSRTARRLTLTALIFLIAGLHQSRGQTITFDDSDPDTIVLSNGTHYELGILKMSGAITYILDTISGDTLSFGSRGIELWAVSFPGAPDGLMSVSPVQGITDSRIHDLNFVWNAENATLTMDFEPDAGALRSVTVGLTITLSTGPHFDMQLTLQNDWGFAAESVAFPQLLQFNLDETSRVIVPGSYPGLILEADFFSQRRNFENLYPGFIFADFVGLEVAGRTLSEYTLRDGLPVRSTRLQLLPETDPEAVQYYSLNHIYNTWIDDGSSWTSPVSRFRVGGSFLESLREFRVDNGLDRFPSLQTKLGAQFEKVARSPIFSHAFGESAWGQESYLTFQDFPAYASKHPSPAILLFGQYWEGGMYYGETPPVLPPDPQWGTTEDFRQMVSELQARGNLVMPFTLPSFWHENSPWTLAAPSISDIVEMDRDGNPVISIDGESTWYLVSPYSPFVRQQLHQLFVDVFDTYGVDMIYEDVIGARAPELDFNIHMPTVLDHAQGWLEHTRKYADSLIVVEAGYDRMAETAVGFMGTLIRIPEAEEETWDYATGTGTMRPWPIAPVLFHDKVIPYPFWSQPAITTDRVSWCLLFGCPLVIGIDDRVPERASDSPWVDVTHDFTSRVISRMTGKQMTDYSEPSGTISESRFEDISVVRNWDPQNSHAVGSHTIAPHGALVTSDANDLIAGVLTRVNGENLSPGEHFLVIEQFADSILVRQPLGSDTPLTLTRPAGWDIDSRIYAYAISPTDTRTIGRNLSSGSIQFELNRAVASDTVAYYKFVYEASGVSTEEDLDVPGQFRLFQPFPNPFDTDATIRYLIPRSERVEIEVFNVTGQMVARLSNTTQSAGEYTLVWDGRTGSGKELAAGVYVVKVKAGNQHGYRSVVKLR